MRLSFGSCALCLFGIGLFVPTASGDCPLFSSHRFAYGNGKQVLGDLDGDSDLDLAVVRVDDASRYVVTILKNDGHGTFRAVYEYPAGLSLRDIAAADLDADGDLDVVVADMNADVVTVFKNQGDGSLAGSRNYTTGNEPVAIALGDIDGDGDGDIVSANSWGQSISIFRNRGDGTFMSGMNSSLDYLPASIEMGDLDGDADLDLALGAYDRVCLMENTGGGFWERMTVAAEAGVQGLSLADLDGDGDPDLATLAYSPYLGLSMFVNQAAWSFSPARYFSHGGSLHSAMACDVDLDDDLDFLGIDDLNKRLVAFENDGTGHFVAESQDLAGNPRDSAVIGDLDGDLDPDLAVSTESGDVCILKNLGKGVFPATADHRLSWSMSAGTAADLNGDGYKELLCVCYGVIYVLPNQGQAAFSKPAALAPRGVQALAGADLDGDGRVDLALACSAASSSGLAVCRGKGDGTFETQVTYPTGNTPSGVAVCDLDGDGDVDVALSSSTGASVSVLRNAGNGTFAFKTDYPVGTGPGRLVLEDFNTDGAADIAVLHSSGKVSVLLNAGNSAFSPAVAYSVGTTLTDLLASDFDLDGDADLVTANGSENRLSLLSNNGTGTFASSPLDLGTPPFRLAAADYDGDGISDLAVTGQSSSRLLLLLGNGHGYQAPLDYPIWRAPGIPLAADYDLDGDTDLAISGINTVGVLLGTRVPNLWPPAQPACLGKPTGFCVYGSPIPGTGYQWFKDGTTPVGGNNPVLLIDQVNPSDIGSYHCVVTGPCGQGATLPARLVQSRIVSAPESLQVGSGETAVLSVEAEGQNLAYQWQRGGVSLQNGELISGVSTATLTISSVDQTHAGRYQVVVSDPCGLVGSREIVLSIADCSGLGMPAVSYETGEASFLAVGLLNADTYPDFVTLRWPGRLSTWMNMQDGTYTFGAEYVPGGSPQCLALGDMDGDGDADLCFPSSTNKAVSLLMNDGGGGFVAGTSCPTGTDPSRLAVFDCDGDTDLDVAVTSSASSTVSILKNQGNGVLTKTADLSCPEAASVCSVDVDRDGDTDLAVASGGIQKQLIIFTNDGSGTFTAARQYSTGSVPRWIVTGDLDGDGDLDLVVTEYTAISVYRNSGTGAFTEQDHIMVSYGEGPALVDMDGDGALDILAVSYEQKVLSFVQNRGSCEFAPPVRYTVAPWPSYLDVADIDKDGDPDVLISHRDIRGVSVLRTWNSPRVQPVDQTVCEGSSAAFAAVAEGRPGSVYQWYKNGTTPVGSNSPTLMINPARPDDSGTYHCVVGVPCGPAPSLPVRLTVRARAGADLDGDCDVDAGSPGPDDLDAFLECASGPAQPHDGSDLCSQADFDDDGDVDQQDFSFLQRCLSGSGFAVDPDCG